MHLLNMITMLIRFQSVLTGGQVAKPLLAILLFQAVSLTAAIITFDNPTIGPGSYLSYKNYYEDGIWFRVTAPIPYTPLAWIDRYSVDVIALPANGTPHAEFKRDYANPDDFVVFSPTNGASFGVVSVDLAEPYPNLHTSSTVVFAGLKTDGSMVTNTFATDGFNDGKGGLADFQTFTFDSSFSSGLTSVQIVSHPWAMDNLVIVPEPGPAALMLGGLAALVWRIRTKKRK